MFLSNLNWTHFIPKIKIINLYLLYKSKWLTKSSFIIYEKNNSYKITPKLQTFFMFIFKLHQNSYLKTHLMRSQVTNNSSYMLYKYKWIKILPKLWFLFFIKASDIPMSFMATLYFVSSSIFVGFNLEWMIPSFSKYLRISAIWIEIFNFSSFVSCCFF